METMKNIQLKYHRCPYCHDDIQRGIHPKVCPNCHALHHLACWGEHGSCSACGSIGTFQIQLEDTIPSQEEMAYLIWLKKGRPEGQSEKHWHEACTEINRLKAERKKKEKNQTPKQNMRLPRASRAASHFLNDNASALFLFILGTLSLFLTAAVVGMSKSGARQLRSFYSENRRRTMRTRMIPGVFGQPMWTITEEEDW